MKERQRPNANETPEQRSSASFHNLAYFDIVCALPAARRTNVGSGQGIATAIIPDEPSHPQGLGTRSPITTLATALLLSIVPPTFTLLPALLMFARKAFVINLFRFIR